MNKRSISGSSPIGELKKQGYGTSGDDKKSMDAVENLAFLHDCLVNGFQPPPGLHKWLIASLERWLQGEPLGDAFSIADDARERRYRRDEKLRDYADMLRGSPWGNSCLIAAEVRKLRQNSRRCDEIIKAIDAIFRIPESERQINRILQNTDKRPY